MAARSSSSCSGNLDEQTWWRVNTTGQGRPLAEGVNSDAPGEGPGFAAGGRSCIDPPNPSIDLTELPLVDRPDRERFLGRDSVSRLVAAVLAEQDDEWQYGERSYLSETSMRRLLNTLTGVPDPQTHVLPLAARPKNTVQRGLTCLDAPFSQNCPSLMQDSTQEREEITDG